MPRYIKRIWAGDVYEAKEYFSPRERGMSCERAAKENLSSDEMAEYNCIEARRKCARMVNANFRQGDLFLTLTFREKVDVEDALRLFRNFISRLKRLRKRKGYSELKYLYVVESKRKREHIHLLINKMDISMKELSEVWGLGRVMVSILEPGGDYTTGFLHHQRKLQRVRKTVERQPEFRKAKSKGHFGFGGKENEADAGAEELQGH